MIDAQFVNQVALFLWMPGNGDGWAPYPDLDNVLRHGQRLPEVQALALLRETRARRGALAPFSNEEDRVALRDRLRRA